MVTKKCTLFCDIDGTLFVYRQFATYKSTTPTKIESAIDEVNKAYDEGHCVVLTTARPEYLRAHTMKELDGANVQYHQLVMGIERGSRILINDNETETIDRAHALCVKRNEGFMDAQVKSFRNILNK
jgi:hypothetical protein